MNVPQDLKYTRTHEWVKLDGDIATIGISDYAQSELGDVVFVELPPIGKMLSAQESLGSVESVKTVSDVYAPIAGSVTETNGDLASKSELVNTDPYGAGWLLKLRVQDSKELDSLMNAEDYKKSFES